MSLGQISELLESCCNIELKWPDIVPKYCYSELERI